MSEFRDQDLSGATFEHVRLRGARFHDVDLSGAQFRAVALHGVRLRGAELHDVDIHGELENVTLNGVEVGPLVEAELNRRMPDRVQMRNLDDSDAVRAAYATLEHLWAGTVQRARRLPEAMLHESVDEEWSFVQTVRHLNFATAAWIGRMFLGHPAPWHPLDLPWDEAEGWEGIPWDREARPSLDEVLAVRAERQTMVREVLAELTDEAYAGTVSRTEPGWPQAEAFESRYCFHIVVNEEWEHRLYAERDLAVLESR